MTTLIGEYAPLDLSGLSEHAATDVSRRLVDGSWRDWSEAAARVGYCARPIRLHGSCVRVDRSTGERGRHVLLRSGAVGRVARTVWQPPRRGLPQL